MDLLILFGVSGIGLVISAIYTGNISIMLIGLFILLISINYFMFSILYEQIYELYEEIQLLSLKKK